MKKIKEMQFCDTPQIERDAADKRIITIPYGIEGENENIV